MLLSKAEIGGIYEIEEINLPVDTKRRLEALGFTGRTNIEVMNRKAYGAVIIKVRGTRFAMGKRIASGILVRKAAA